MTPQNEKQAFEASGLAPTHAHRAAFHKGYSAAVLAQQPQGEPKSHLRQWSDVIAQLPVSREAAHVAQGLAEIVEGNRYCLEWCADHVKAGGHDSMAEGLLAILAVLDQGAPSARAQQAESVARDAVEQFKSALCRVPYFASRVNKATREKLTEAHSIVLNLPALLDQVHRAAPAPSTSVDDPPGCDGMGCDKEGCNGACMQEDAQSASAQGCTRSHPHENMSAECQQKTNEARAARASAQQADRECSGREWWLHALPGSELAVPSALRKCQKCGSLEHAAGCSGTYVVSAPNASPAALTDAKTLALGAMVDAMRWWGAQEDGIPAECRNAFDSAMLALGWSYSHPQDLKALAASPAELMDEVRTLLQEIVDSGISTSRIKRASALLAASPAAPTVTKGKFFAEVTAWTDDDWREVFACFPDIEARFRAVLTGPAAPTGDEAERIEQLHKALFESRDAMRVMASWVKKSDPAGYSWAVRMVDRANNVLGHGTLAAQPPATAAPQSAAQDAMDAARWRAVKPFLRVYTDDFEEREYMPPNIGTMLSVSKDEDMMPGRLETPDAWADEAIDAAMSASKEGNGNG